MSLSEPMRDTKRTIPDELICSECGCSKALCLEYKLHGAVACCPDCKHLPVLAESPARQEPT